MPGARHACLGVDSSVPLPAQKEFEKAEAAMATAKKKTLR